MKKSFTYLLFLVTTLFLACEKHADCVKGTGKVITEERVIDDFRKVLVLGFFELNLVQDTINKLTVKGSENALDFVTSNVHTDTLIIKDGSPCRWSRDYEIMELSLHFKELVHLITDYPVNVFSADTLKLNKFTFWSIGEIGDANLILDCQTFDFYTSHNTLGHYYFSGRSDFTTINIHYGTAVFANNFISREANLFNRSVGDIYIRVTDKLRATLESPGNIYYYGNPEITLESNTGKGELISIQE